MKQLHLTSNPSRKGVKKIDSTCLKCRYYTRKKGHSYYKCYTSTCPASIRDREILNKEDKMRGISISEKKFHIWAHSKHCKCGYCCYRIAHKEREAGFIDICHNGGDFDRVDLPKKIGDKILLQDQSGECYLLTKVRK